MLDGLLGEKRTDRLDVPRQLRVGETLGRLIRKLASRSGRTQQQMMVVLLTKGIEPYCRETGNDLSSLLHEAASDSVRPGPIWSKDVREKDTAA